MTDRDHFAAAALTGLLAASDANSWADDLWADDLCRTAYGWADFMLRERGNQPEPPDSSPVTEPMPKEKRAEVSARIDGVDRPVPYSRTDEKRVNWPTIRDTTQPRTKEAATMSDDTERSVASDGSVADIIDRLCDAVKEDEPPRRALLVSAAAEIERLRFAIRRLADQDATLSVCEGNVTVTTDATLTDAEREAVEHFAREFRGPNAATLRGLLERLK